MLPVKEFTLFYSEFTFKMIMMIFFEKKKTKRLTDMGTGSKILDWYCKALINDDYFSDKINNSEEL